MYSSASAFIEKFLAKLLCSCVRLTLGGIAWVDHELDELDEICIGTVRDSDATRSDLTTNSSVVTEENVMEHITRMVPWQTQLQEESKRWAVQ